MILAFTGAGDDDAPGDGSLSGSAIDRQIVQSIPENAGEKLVLIGDSDIDAMAAADGLDS